MGLAHITIHSHANGPDEDFFMSITHPAHEQGPSHNVRTVRASEQGIKEAFEACYLLALGEVNARKDIHPLESEGWNKLAFAFQEKAPLRRSHEPYHL